MHHQGFHFTTFSGNTYYYNDLNGEVYYDIKEMNNFINENNINNYDNYNNINQIESSIEQYLVKYGYKQLTLINTEDCNLRCKYCSFSGQYKNQRKHNEVYMTNDIALESVDKYLFTIKKVRFYNPQLIPIIGFYGGEPLLNISSIINVVEHIEKYWSELGVRYTITTNGTLLDDNITDFFIKKNFFICISFNGYKEENDRLRIYKNGYGTFDDIIKNIEKIRKKNIDYFYNNCSVIVTYDIGTNIKQLYKYFIENKKYLPKISRISRVSELYTSWYSQYSKNQKDIFYNDFDELKRLFFTKMLNNEAIDQFLLNLFWYNYYVIINRPLNIPIEYFRNSLIPYTGTCIPGTKLAVDSKGLLHCCEKVNFKIPIGNVDRWIDYLLIKKIIENYNDVFKNSCKECSIRRLCPICFALVIDENGEFKLDEKLCSTIKNNVINNFREIYSYFELGLTPEKFIQYKKQI